MMQQLLETLDAARLLGLSSERVRELANTGRLPVANVTPSGRRLFSRSDVERFRAERQGRRQAATR